MIYTAHYDTCATLPFPNFITPKNFIIYILFQIGLVIALIASLFIITILLFLFKVPYPLEIIEVILWAIMALMLFGPANKHTANDNTSGITVIIDTINSLPDELKENAAFILFDLEEAGLIGSISYRLKHNKALKNKLLINFDCVSDGNNILIKVKRKAKTYIPAIKAAFKSNDNYSIGIATRRVFYPSDQELFPCGVAVAALRKTKLFKIQYMNRIHTKRDVIYNEENINYLVNCSIALLNNVK